MVVKFMKFSACSMHIATDMVHKDEATSTHCFWLSRAHIWTLCNGPWKLVVWDKTHSS